MSLPLQLTVDLNDIARQLLEFSKDAKHAGSQAGEIAYDLRRELGRAETLQRFITTGKLNGSLCLLDVVGDMQRRTFLESFDRAKAYLTKLTDMISVEQDTNSSGPSTTKDIDGPSSFGKLKRRYTWAAGSKNKSEKILKQFIRLNDRLNEDVILVTKLFVETGSKTASAIQDDINAQNLGVSAGLNLARIARNEAPLRTDLLHDFELSLPATSNTANLSECLHFGLLRNSYPVLIEYRAITESTENIAARDRALKLATFLHEARVFGISTLKCGGLYVNKKKQRHEYIFEVPKQFATTADPRPTSLHTFLSPRGKDRPADGLFRYFKFRPDPDFGTTIPLTLSQRIKVAHSIAHTVYRLHLVEWLHQNINSSNIWFICPSTPQTGSGLQAASIGEPYLLGFQYARLAWEYSDTDMRKVFAPEQNIYRHPDRQIRPFEPPKVPHARVHDVYALGVVLLEVGLGAPAVELLHWRPHVPGYAVVDAPEGRMDFYLFLAKHFLPEKMGESYARITRRCLTGKLRDEGESADEAMNPSTEFRTAVVDRLRSLLNALE